jgi:hypothetical protein
VGMLVARLLLYNGNKILIKIDKNMNIEAKIQEKITHKRMRYFQPLKSAVSVEMIRERIIEERAISLDFIDNDFFKYITEIHINKDFISIKNDVFDRIVETAILNNLRIKVLMSVLMLKIGDHIKMGKILFQSITSQEKNPTLLAYEIVKLSSFDYKRSNNWENSSLRKYLNGDFVDEFGFNETERDSLFEQRHIVYDDMGEVSRRDVVDRIRIPGEEEIITMHPRISISKLNYGSMSSYWLINPISRYSDCVRIIYNQGQLVNGQVCNYGRGIVPLLSLKEDLLLNGSGTKNDPYCII